MTKSANKISYCECCDSYNFCTLEFKHLSGKDNIFIKWDDSEDYQGKKVDAIYFEKDFCLILIEFKNYAWFIENNPNYCLEEIEMKIHNTSDYLKNNNLYNDEPLYPCFSYDTNHISFKEVTPLIENKILSKITTLYNMIEKQDKTIKFGNCEKIYHYCNNIINHKK